MSMLTWYLVALVIGGVLVAVSLIFGADHDSDAGADADADADADAGGDHEMEHGVSAADALQSWLPFASLRFWTFALAFFGLTGTVMSAANLAGGIVTTVVSVGVGYVCGASITAAIRKLRTQVVDSSLGEADYVGSIGQVVLPVGKGRTGKIRMSIKDRVVELMADTDDDESALAIGESVIVYAVKNDGRVVVARSDKLPQ